MGETALVLLQLFNFKLDKTLLPGFYILFGTGIGEIIDQIQIKTERETGLYSAEHRRENARTGAWRL